MRPIGTSKQLQQRRDHALKLLKHGRRSSEVAQRVGVTPRSVRRWHQETKGARPKVRSNRSPGRPCRLTPRQLKHLVRVLARGSVAYGYSSDSWTVKRVQGLIRKLFGVGYQASSVWYLLYRMKWSCQKPQRVGFQHDEAAIAYWKRYRWPWIKNWQTLGATLVFLDESGKSLVCPIKRAWAPRGQTPKMPTSLNHHQRANLIGALLISPKAHRIRLRMKLYQRSITGEQVIEFLKHVLQHISGPIVLVWDNAPIHTRKKVQAFIAEHPRLHVYWFPTCAPELNPVEHVWAQLNDYLRPGHKCQAALRQALRPTRKSRSC